MDEKIKEKLQIMVPDWSKIVQFTFYERFIVVFTLGLHSSAG